MKFTEMLSSEHALIERVVGAFQTYRGAFLTGDAPRADGVKFCRFFREFVGRVHHDREESVLFFALTERVGLPADRGPIAALHTQHNELAHCVDQVEKLLTIGDRDPRMSSAVAELTKRFAHGLLQHIDAENTVLFPESVVRLTRVGVLELPWRDLSAAELALRDDGERLAAIYVAEHDPSAFRGEGCVMCPSFGSTCDGVERTWWNEFEWEEFADHIG